MVPRLLPEWLLTLSFGLLSAQAMFRSRSIRINQRWTSSIPPLAFSANLPFMRRFPQYIRREQRDISNNRWLTLVRAGQDSISSPPLQEFLDVISPEEERLYKLLIDLGQTHIFDSWPATGTDDDKKRNFFEQVRQLERSYPGGFRSYLNKAKQLLKGAVQGDNPFDGMVPEVPEGETLTFSTPAFFEAEQRGLVEAKGLCFVLVAGGLGERLGYSGIKLALPVETVTNTTYLELYVKYILALQERCRRAGQPGLEIPLAIMTSDDTDKKTRDLLVRNNYFGMSPSQLSIIKQDKVPALQDSSARLACMEQDPYTLDTKPHGHGDVHHLLLREKLVEKWSNEGKKWIFFMQDTNALVLNSVLPALGISASRSYQMNSVCMPRSAGEASGAITKLTDRNGKSLIINVEYNQLDPLLRATTYPNGDANDPATGFSPFPGNANNLVFELDSYYRVLSGEDQGIVSEFVNPKFKDSSRTTFTKPTRLECMMQDFPKLMVKELPGSPRIGFTSFEKWVSFSPAKNSLESGAKAAKSGTPPATASSAEFDFFAANARKLAQAGAYVGPSSETSYAGVPLTTGPVIVLSPSFAITHSELVEKLDSSKISISSRSSLVVDGEGVYFEGLELDGSLTIRTAPGVTLRVKEQRIENSGLEFVELGPDATEEQKIRGYQTRDVAGLVVDIKEPGNYILADGVLEKESELVGS